MATVARDGGHRARPATTSSSSSTSCSAKLVEGKIIEEKYTSSDGVSKIRQYRSSHLLGKGGFAYCYHVTDMTSQKEYACKIVSKSSFRKQRTKEKLRSEIKIHSSLNHRNVVKFERVFEDSENVYIILELCRNQTLLDLLKRKKRLSEAEAKYFVRQMLQALKYLQRHRIIHRDLKLGNLFLAEGDVIKVGDFGLAASLAYDGERKKTICGTPNYIAPEVLDNTKGHSYEVDVWSLGVILYTFLIGRPPFETSNVKATYKRIKSNDYEFPEKVKLSDAAKDLITSILQTDPRKRPTIEGIMSHPFMSGTSTSDVTDMLAKKLDLKQASSGKHSKENVENSVPVQYQLNSNAGSAQIGLHRAKYGTTSARPGLKASNTLAKATTSSTTATTTSAGQGSEGGRLALYPHKSGEDEREEREMSAGGEAAAAVRRAMTSRDKPTHITPAPSSSTTASMGTAGHSRPASALARTGERGATGVSGEEDVIHVRRVGTVEKGSSNGSDGEKGIASSLSAATTTTTTTTTAAAGTGAFGSSAGVGSVKSEKGDQEVLHFLLQKLGRLHFISSSSSSSSSSSGHTPTSPLHGSGGRRAAPLTSEGPSVFVSKWVDYSKKYGLGYQLNNGFVGVYFNDSTKIILDINTGHFEYIERRAKHTSAERYDYTRRFDLNTYPNELNKKVTLLRHFASYLDPDMNIDHLEPSSAPSSSSLSSSSPSLTFVKKWIRTKHAVIMRMNNDTFQVTFNDQTEVVLTADKQCVSYVDRNGARKVRDMRDVETDKHFSSRMKYVKEILQTLLSKSGATSGGGGGGGGDAEKKAV